MNTSGEPPGDEARARFQRRQRLVHKRDFAQVFRTPVRFADRYFTILAIPGTAGHARLGLAISRRVARRAVDRNRLKRLIRESFRQQRDLPALDLVVMARAGAADADNARLTASLARHWTRMAQRFRDSDDSDG